MPNGLHSEWDFEALRAHWEKSEDIAMHFNQLLIGLRIKAIGALGLAVALGAGLLQRLPSDGTGAASGFSVLALRRIGQGLTGCAAGVTFSAAPRGSTYRHCRVNPSS